MKTSYIRAAYRFSDYPQSSTPWWVYKYSTRFGSERVW